MTGHQSATVRDAPAPACSVRCGEVADAELGWPGCSTHAESSGAGRGSGNQETRYVTVREVA